MCTGTSGLPWLFLSRLPAVACRVLLRGGLSRTDYNNIIGERQDNWEKKKKSAFLHLIILQFLHQGQLNEHNTLRPHGCYPTILYGI